MPYINIRTAGALTREQKAQIAEEVTEMMERIANKPRSYTYVTFDEVAEENWAVAGRLLDEA
jgi:4-oxalocrotonate tautomerase